MTDSESISYYRARELQERTLASSATDPAVSAIHLEMASRYAWMIKTSERSLSPDEPVTTHVMPFATRERGDRA